MAPSVQPVFSRHAAARMQQRGIPSSLVERVLRHGRQEHDHHGGVIVYVDRAMRQRLRRSGEAHRRDVERLAGVYVVMTNGVIATVGHRYRRMRRK